MDVAHKSFVLGTLDSGTLEKASVLLFRKFFPIVWQHLQKCLGGLEVRLFSGLGISELWCGSHAAGARRHHPVLKVSSPPLREGSGVGLVGSVLPFVVPDAAGLLGADCAAIVSAAGTAVIDFVAVDAACAAADDAMVLQLHNYH